ncbi:MAG TPA: OmpA family protein [Rhodopila sp.]|uniref:OmpA family protein n=1 Tax=Rhodopila sp. TaxID=2480087 RepID=UPI002B7CB5A5|nr:OmpA family protein [Rhodopila sp.]HVY16086.1 OmpA family protein [Rhodopila sp.]
MNDDDPSPGGLTEAQADWASHFLHIDVRVTNPPMKPLLDSMIDAAAAAMPSGTPKATATDLFFDKDDSTLTDSDRTSLDSYIAAYTGAASSEKVTIDAYASMEGDEGHNKTLADQRAAAVATYLGKHGIPKDRIAFAGHGRTDRFSKSDLSQNRRATLKPPPPHASAPAQGQPNGKGSLKMRGTPDMRKEGEEAAGREVEAHPRKDPGVSRDDVEAALKTFLHDLAGAQKHKTGVTATDRVVVAENTLREGLDGRHVVDRPETKDYDPDELAHKIAANLPDFIPRANYEKFLRLKAIEAPKEGSITDDARKKYQEERDKVINKLPKKIQDYGRKAMDAAFEHGTTFVADELMQAAGVNSTLEGEMKDVVDKWTEKVTGSNDGDSK